MVQPYTVEALDETPPERSASAANAGRSTTYEKLGFLRDCKLATHRRVVTRVAEPRS